MADAELRVCVAYATSASQCELEVTVPAGSTIEAAIRASGVLARYGEIDLAQNPVGVFGHRAALTERVRDGDRVEIYRRLLADPKEARRRRALKAKRSR
jgi:putative ubiquitin-RnfH superfamily antitoxin RatB of RatAB toxin-antitoxin module